MEESIQPRISDVDRLHDGVVITFDNGKCAAYSASLLLSIFPLAVEIFTTPEENLQR